MFTNKSLIGAGHKTKTTNGRSLNPSAQLEGDAELDDVSVGLLLRANPFSLKTFDHLINFCHIPPKVQLKGDTL